MIRSALVFTIVVAVHNDWNALEGCLEALGKQRNLSDFEVVIVDDGSDQPAPNSVLEWNRFFLITIIRQEHAGISRARNKGIQAARGSVVVFVDADSRMQPDCIEALESKITQSPRESCFQLRLIGDRSRLVGRAEELRLTALQDHLLQPSGLIRYLNTAGFAILQSRIPSDGNLFNPIAARGEDTFLLSTLMKRGELPVFVPGAIVQHAVSLSLLGCFRKDIRSAYAERKAYDLIAARGISIRLTNRERRSILSSMWRTSGEPTIGRAAWFIVTGRQALRLLVSAFHRLTC
jgi:glycosyltransferase involved in cell wall biosynthesis